jgi:hypothetical protein
MRMLRTETWSFPSSGGRLDDIGMKNSKCHIMVPVRLGPPSTISRVPLGPSAHTSMLFGEWQQRGPEIVSGYVVRKLRLTLLAPPQFVFTANAAG